jgi:hypothetical protein
MGIAIHPITLSGPRIKVFVGGGPPELIISFAIQGE